MRSVEVKPGGFDDFLSGMRQPGLALKETNLFADNGAIDTPFV